MKKTICLLLLVLITSISFFGCTNRNKTNESFSDFEDDYELCYDWKPYGAEINNGDYISFKNDPDNIFVIVKKDLFSYGTTYHKKTDTFPTFSKDLDNIDKITLLKNKKEIELDRKFLESFVTAIVNISDENTVKADLGKETIFVDVYYKGYPAYQTNKWMICSSESGELGIMFCETKENDIINGSGRMAKISSVALKEYLESLF